MSGCQPQFTKKYLSRSSPNFPANQCRGQTLVGNDGVNMYMSKKASNGVYRWVKLKREPIENILKETRTKSKKIKSRKPRKTSVKSRKPRKTSVKSRKPKKTSVKSRKPKKTSVKSRKPKKTSVKARKPKKN